MFYIAWELPKMFLFWGGLGFMVQLSWAHRSFLEMLGEKDSGILSTDFEAISS